MSTSHSSDLPAYADSIHHDGSSRYVIAESGQEPRLGEEVLLRIRTSPAAPVRTVLLRTCPDGEQAFIEMRPGARTPACLWWEARVKLTMPTVNYRFLLFTDDGPLWYNAAGVQRHLSTDAEDFRLVADYLAPRWVWDSVFYQILPDRFADGDPASNVRDGEFSYRGFEAKARQWGEPSSAKGAEAMVEFYGGDLKGIEDRLDYLVDLGVNALYINPVFSAFSNHRYDVVDYFGVDSHLGGNPALVSLRSATAARQMRFILDIVPNHCGVNHPWFQDAQADQTCQTAEYFIFNRHPDDYECWLGVKSLPKLNYRSEKLRRIMYSGPDAVFRHWLRPPYSADGWRIDVANMLGRYGANQMGMEVGQGIHWAVKEENPEAYILGENFFDSTGQLQGDCWDATMNYAGFSQPLWYWLSGFEIRQHQYPQVVESSLTWPTSALVESWQAHRAAVPWAIARQQLNMLGSHDTRRIASVVRGDKSQVRLALGLMMTYVGVPCIFYGDEIGLEGQDPESARGCMLWDRCHWDEELRTFHQKLIRLRRTSSALISGGFQVLTVENDSLSYLRDTDQEQIVVIGHRGPGPREACDLPVLNGGVEDGSVFTEIFTGSVATVQSGRLPIPSMGPGISIWQCKLLTGRRKTRR